MSEFASGAALSSIIGQSLNPHDLTRTPSGSSGGTGVAIAAAYATIGLGTDTGGSVRGPATSNGIAALKPTHGLLSRDGIIPLALIVRHRRSDGAQRRRRGGRARRHDRRRSGR